MRILLPKRFSDVDSRYGPFFFLAGPVRGGGDWQNTACMELFQRLPQFQAALPCRYNENHPLLVFRAPGNDDVFKRQLNWERRYLNLAATTGCIIFWLPCESKTEPRADGQPYAMDTRGELGEWRGRLMYNPTLRIVVGAEPDFHGLSQIQRNFDMTWGTKFPIYPTLKETIDAAIKKVTVSS